jgi:hypothetical protein
VTFNIDEIVLAIVLDGFNASLEMSISLKRQFSSEQ